VDRASARRDLANFGERGIACKTNRYSDKEQSLVRIGAMNEEPIHREKSRHRKKQLHKRVGWRTAWQVLEQLSSGQIPVGRACEWLGISRSRLYVLKKRWLSMRGEKNPHWLYARPDTGISRLPTLVQGYLEEEMGYIREGTEFFKGHYNFAMLAEECQKRFGKRFHRNTLRRWAIQQGHFDPKKDVTRKAHLRFETGGIGFLYQHDSSIHLWVPGTGRKDVLILTIDDHSRKIVGYQLVPQDTSWHHLCVVRETIERYGCPVAYYTDNAMIFAPLTATCF